MAGALLEGEWMRPTLSEHPEWWKRLSGIFVKCEMITIKMLVSIRGPFGEPGKGDK